MHLKRNKMPKTWPLQRKGSKYLVRTNNALDNGIPLIVAIRDILKFATNRKDVKKILNLGNVKVNSKIVKEEKFPITLFDVLTLDNKHFRLVLQGKKYNLIETDKADEKINKIISKKNINGNQIQVNLRNGQNFITKEKVKVGDSVVINFSTKKVKIIEFKKGNEVLFISGKHLGEKGIISSIDEKLVKIKTEKEEISSTLENLMVI